MNNELAKTLTVALVNYLDENRPEGTMCCSSAECERLEKAFEVNNLDFVEGFMEKKLSRLTEFELRLLDWLSSDTSGEIPMERMKEVVKNRAAELLALAKKELLSYADERNPAIEAIAELEKTFESNPEKLPRWLQGKLGKKHLEGYIKGREDALREMNDFMGSHFNTQSGTASATLDCNTSATDGKEHNPSFTD